MSGFNLLGGSGEINLNRSSVVNTYAFVNEYINYSESLSPNNGIASEIQTLDHIISRLNTGDNIFKVFSLILNSIYYIYVVSTNGSYLNLVDSDTILSDGNIFTFAGEGGAEGIAMRERGPEFTVAGGVFTEYLSNSLDFS